MKKDIVSLFVLAMGMMLFLCGLENKELKKEASFVKAIEVSRSLKTVEEKVNYLLAQAEAFYNAKEYQDVVEIASTIMHSLDKNNKAARDWMAKAEKAISDQDNALKAKGLQEKVNIPSK